MVTLPHSINQTLVFHLFKSIFYLTFGPQHPLTLCDIWEHNVTYSSSLGFSMPPPSRELSRCFGVRNFYNLRLVFAYKQVLKCSWLVEHGRAGGCMQAVATSKYEDTWLCSTLFCTFNYTLICSVITQSTCSLEIGLKHPCLPLKAYECILWPLFLLCVITYFISVFFQLRFRFFLSRI